MSARSVTGASDPASTDDPAKSTCLRKDDHGLYKLFGHGGVLTAGSTTGG